MTWTPETPGVYVLSYGDTLIDRRIHGVAQSKEDTMRFEPGDRVVWAEVEPDDPPDERGIVLKPSQEDLDYFVMQNYPANRNVLVEWNGDDWDTAWHDPRELKPAGECPAPTDG